MSHFVFYQDKENSQLGVLGPRSQGPLGGARPKAGPGKTFSGPSLPRAPHKSLAPTPRDSGTRRALGGLNIAPSQRSPRAQRGSSQGGVFLKPAAPAAKPQRQAKVQTSSQPKKPEEVYPEIEHIPVYTETEDTFEDVWPAADRPDTHIPALRDWRPSSLRVCEDERRDDSDDLLARDSLSDDSLDDIHALALRSDDPDLVLSWEVMPDLLSTVCLPPLEDPFCDDSFAMLL